METCYLGCPKCYKCSYFKTFQDKKVSSAECCKPKDQTSFEGLYNKAVEIYNKEYSEGAYCHKQSFLWGFEEGSNYPSDKIIKKILDLAWKYNASDVEVNNLTEEGEFKYVKEHLSD